MLYSIRVNAVLKLQKKGYQQNNLLFVIGHAKTYLELKN